MTVTTAPAPQRPTARRGARGWWAATWTVVGMILIPPVGLVWMVISRGAGTTIPAGRLVELTIATLTLTVAVTLTAVTIGTATAWLTTRTSLPGRRMWMILAAVPLVVPSYMVALTLIGATGPRGLIAESFGIVVPVPYGFVGAWLALGLFLAPIVHLLVVPALRDLDPALEDAARGLGARPWKVFRTVTLAQLRPALVSASLLVGLYTMSDFGAVSLLRFDTFTRAIYTLYAGQIDRRPAATLSLVLMTLTLLVLIAERRWRIRATYMTSTSRRRPPLRPLSRAGKTAATLFMASFSTLTALLPITVLVYWLGRGLGGGQVAGAVWDELGRSLGVSGAAALVTTMLAFPVAMTTTWRRGRSSAVAEASVWGVYSLPHITVGIAVVGLALTLMRPLYQTIGLLVATYAAMFLAQAMSSTQDSLRRMSPALEDVSRSLGRGPLETLRRVILPIAKPGLAAGAALVFLSVMKELPATLLLRPNGFETLAVRIWSTTGEGFYTRASVASLALLAVSIVPLLVLTNRDLSD